MIPGKYSHLISGILRNTLQCWIIVPIPPPTRSNYTFRFSGIFPIQWMTLQRQVCALTIIDLHKTREGEERRIPASARFHGRQSIKCMEGIRCHIMCMHVYNWNPISPVSSMNKFFPSGQANQPPTTTVTGLIINFTHSPSILLYRLVQPCRSDDGLGKRWWKCFTSHIIAERQYVNNHPHTLHTLGYCHQLATIWWWEGRWME